MVTTLNPKTPSEVEQGILEIVNNAMRELKETRAQILAEFEDMPFKAGQIVKVAEHESLQGRVNVVAHPYAFVRRVASKLDGGSYYLDFREQFIEDVWVEAALLTPVEDLSELPDPEKFDVPINFTKTVEVVFNFTVPLHLDEEDSAE